jgi:hypothetical protein
MVRGMRRRMGVVVFALKTTFHLCIAILISTSKTLVPSDYCLYSFFDKIRDKGKRFLPGIEEMGGKEGLECVVREGVGAGGRNDRSLVCTYE